MSEQNDGFVFPLEILSCPWSELTSHCSGGNVFLVDSSIDLKSLAQAIAEDDTTFVEHVMREKKMWKANKNELSAHVTCSFVIVQPYIFVEVPT